MFRRYNRWHSRFDQPDPYDGSYSLTDPQSFNRYAYVQNDPVNSVDPTGLDECKDVDGRSVDCGPPVPAGDVIRIYILAPALGFFYLPASISGSSNIFVTLIPQKVLEPITSPRKFARTIGEKICSAIPSGRTVGVSGGLGLVGGPTGGGEVVINYNSGQVSAFAFGGAQVGWIGGAQASIYSGFVYGLNNSNSNYSGGFTGGNGGAGVGGFAASSSGGLTGGAQGLIPNPRNVTAVGATAGASLLGGASGGLTATHYTKPFQLGRNPLGLGLIDPPLYLARQVCK